MTAGGLLVIIALVFIFAVINMALTATAVKWGIERSGLLEELKKTRADSPTEQANTTP